MNTIEIDKDLTCQDIISKKSTSKRRIEIQNVVVTKVQMPLLQVLDDEHYSLISKIENGSCYVTKMSMVIFHHQQLKSNDC